MFAELVRDCILYGLNEVESLEYIEKRSGGAKLHRSTFYSIKKRISLQDSDTLEERLTQHIRVGFALKHFSHIAGIENIQKILFKSLADEYSKSPTERNLFAISKLAASISQNIQLLRQLNIDLPFVNRMKVEVNKAERV